MADSPLRLYGPAECGPDGYPRRWHRGEPPIKALIRQLEGHRCERCRHPYPPGIAQANPRGEWTPCDEECTHGGPIRVWSEFGRMTPPSETINGPHDIAGEIDGGFDVDAQWRILTVHHLNGVKWDCRWWNLASLCQRCHLTIQRRVLMERVFPLEHTEWFKPHAAGWYASAYLDLDLTREEALARLDELLALERQA